MSPELLGYIGVGLWLVGLPGLVLGFCWVLLRLEDRRAARSALNDVQARERVRPIASGVHVGLQPVRGVVRNWDEGGLRAVRREMDQRMRGDL